MQTQQSGPEYMNLTGYEGLNVLRYPKIASWCDVDLNDHINQSAFIKYCIEAVTTHQKHGEPTLKDLKNVADVLHPRFVQTQYLRELNPEDEIDIVTWQVDHSTLRMDIEGNQGTLFKMLMEV